MRYYGENMERRRRERDTPERILQIAQSKGEFRVSLRWRDDWLRERCAKLRKDGKLRGGRRVIKGELVYYPVVERAASGMEARQGGDPVEGRHAEHDSPTGEAGDAQ